MASTCRSCGKRIEFLTSKGKWVPVETEYLEVTRGAANLEAGERKVVGYTSSGELITGTHPPRIGRVLRVRESHFAHCPQAARHRRRNAK